MIDFISGKIAEKTPTRVVVESSGIGYSLLISTNTFKELPAVGDKTVLKTYLHVREDNIQLFAFSEENERTPNFNESFSESKVFGDCNIFYY